jgi:hypothetical protein
MSVRPHGTRLPLDTFPWSSLSECFFFSKMCRDSLKSDRIIGYFTWRPIYISDHISLNSSQNEKGCIQILYRKLKHVFMFNNFFFRKSCHLWDVKNTTEPGRAQMTTGGMRIVCCIPTATNTPSEYVILIFPIQQWLHERASNLRYTHTVCHVYTGNEPSDTKKCKCLA